MDLAKQTRFKKKIMINISLRKLLFAWFRKVKWCSFLISAAESLDLLELRELVGYSWLEFGKKLLFFLEGNYSIKFKQY